MVMDVSLSFEKLKQDQANGKTPELREQDMLAAMQHIKEQHGK